MKREVFEELGVKFLEESKLFDIYFNNNQNNNNYKIIYVVKKFTSVKIDLGEIAQARMFDMTKLPEDINQPSLHRIEEYLGRRKIEER